MPDLPFGTVTFLFTDIEGSARLWEEDPHAMRLALARHDEIAASVIREFAGTLDAIQRKFNDLQGRTRPRFGRRSRPTSTACRKSRPLASTKKLAVSGRGLQIIVRCSWSAIASPTADR